MQKTFKSTLTAILIPLTVIVSSINFIEVAIAKSTVRIAANKEHRRSPQRRYENYYRDNYQNALNRRIIRRRCKVRNTEAAIDVAFSYLEQNRKTEAAICFAQALVTQEDWEGTQAAFDLQQRLDSEMEDITGRRLREYLPLFSNIFPIRRRVLSTYYTNHYQQAIARRIIRRPCCTRDEDEAIDLAFEAMERGNRNEAARRFGQALVMVEQMEGIQEALELEEELNYNMEDRYGISLSELPLFRRIFPRRASRYAY